MLLSVNIGRTIPWKLPKLSDSPKEQDEVASADGAFPALSPLLGMAEPEQ